MAPSDKENNGSFLPEEGASDAERPDIAINNLPLKRPEFYGLSAAYSYPHPRILYLELTQSFTLLDTGPEIREPPEAWLLKPSLRGLWGRFQTVLLFATDQILDRSYSPQESRVAERLFLGISWLVR